MVNRKEKYKNLVREYLENYTPGYVEFLKKRYENYKYICGFTVGTMGMYVREITNLLDRKLDFYCDNDPEKAGKKDPYGYGINVISLEELRKYKEETVVLIPTRYYKEIYDQLKREQFPLVDRVFSGKALIDEYLRENNIQNIIMKLQETIEVLSDDESCRILSRIVQEWTTNEYRFGQMDDIYTIPQYFPEDIMENNEEEIYVDCGAYTGDNIPDFIQFTGGRFKKYYAFELNKENFNGLQDNIIKNWSNYADKFVPENKGVSDRTEKILYVERGEGSGISDGKGENGATIEGDVIALDDYFGAGEKVSFIKMDIEGEEMHALSGAYKTISRNLPKLAVCIYHKPDDLWEIPLFIKNNWKQYDIYIRHHTDLLTETVCYAVRRA